jgi:Right handed beta helix region
MRLSGLGSRFGLLLALFISACSSSSNDSAPDSGPVTECTARQVLDPSSRSCVTCGDDSKPNADGSACVKLGWQNCPTGFTVDVTGYGCTDISPAADCPAGTMPKLGSTTCQPVGTTSCATGFSADPSGWGCAAIAPAAACTGATMEKLGSATCVPVGDCTATFPPAAATLFVSPSAVVDATHFTTIGAALASASAIDGVTIAIDAGSYAESITLAHKINLVGKCPAQVTVAASGTMPGIAISGVSGASVSNLTISGQSPGVQISAAASITLTSVVVDGNNVAGIALTGAASHLELDSSVVRGSIATASAKGDGIDLGIGTTATVQNSAIIANTEEGIYATGAATSLTVKNSVVTDTAMNASGNFGLGIDVVTQAVAEVDDCFIARNHEAGMVAAAESNLSIKECVISNNVASTAGYGHGVTIDGAQVTIDDSSVVANVDVGVSVEDAPGSLTATNTVFRGQLVNSGNTKGTGVSASNGGVATLTGVALVGNSEEGAFADGTDAVLTLNNSIARDGVTLPSTAAGNGLVAQNGGKLVIQGSALIANHESGLLLFDPITTAQVTQSIIARQLPSQGTQFGRGIVLQNGPSLTFGQSVVATNTDIGLSARGVGTTATLTESLIRDTAPQISDGAHGRALNIIEGATATVTSCELYDDTEVAALVSGASAKVTFTDSVIAHTQLDKKTSTVGRGLASQNSAIVSFTGGVVTDSIQSGVSSGGVNASLAMDTSIVDATKSLPDGTFGHGVLTFDKSDLSLVNVTVRNSGSAGVIVDAAGATISACRILNNAIGINAQDGSSLTQVDTVPDSPNPLEVDVSNDTVFQGNQTRVGSNQLPLPALLGN